MLTSPCLGPGGVGVLDASGAITQTSRDVFVAQVIALLVSGNENGLGAKVSSLAGIPFPPKSNVELFDPDKFVLGSSHPFSDLTWFSPSPFALATFSELRNKDGAYQKLFVDGIYNSLLKLLNVAGNPSAVPIFDYSGILPDSVNLKLQLTDLPKIAVALATPNPLVSLQALDIDLGNIPDFLSSLASVVSIPSVPSLPSVPSFDFDFIVVPDLFLGLFDMSLKALPELVIKLAGDPTALLVPNIGSLLELALNSFLNTLFQLLEKVGLLTIMPKLLMATFIVIMQGLVAALVCAAVSQVVGTGLVVKEIGKGLGL